MSDPRAPQGDQRPPEPPAAALVVFGESLPLAVEYAGLLAAQATLRGLIGPREVPRVWERHLLNCAVLADLVPEGARVCDLGSGAGLPGIALAIRRPDLHVTLVEPLLRRTRFLEEAVAGLGLRQVEVRRARAEELHGRVGAGMPGFDVVTARAVAPLERLAGWALPLAREGGELLAMKGSSAAQEVDVGRAVVRRLGGRDMQVVTLGTGVLAQPVTVVRVVKRAG